MAPGARERVLLPTLVVLALLLSGFAPKDHLTWLLETIRVIVALPLIMLAWKRFPLTRLPCWQLAAHALALIQGGAYTSAETPLGFWLRDVLGFERNPWDRVGHFMQGFSPATLARELLLRLTRCAATAGGCTWCWRLA